MFTLTFKKPYVYANIQESEYENDSQQEFDRPPQWKYRDPLSGNTDSGWNPLQWKLVKRIT